MTKTTITLPDSIRFTIPAKAAGVILDESIDLPKGVEVTREGDLTIPAGSLPAEAIVRLVEYGASRFINDKAGGTSKTEDDKANIVSAWTERLVSGDLARKGGGGRRLSLEDRALREVMESRLRKWGKKAAEAKKLASDPQHALRTVIADKIGKRVDSKDVTKLFDKNWPSIQAEADTLAAKWREADEATGEVELDLGNATDESDESDDTE